MIILLNLGNLRFFGRSEALQRSLLVGKLTLEKTSLLDFDDGPIMLN